MKAITIPSWLLIFLLICSLTGYGLIKFSQPAFVHDELQTIKATQTETWISGYKNINEYKPRLLANAFCNTVFRISTDDRTLALFVSMLFHILTLTVYALIIIQIFKIPYYLAACCIAALSISRFNLFHFAETSLGIIEGPAHIFFLCAVYGCIKTIQSQKILWGYITAIFITLSVLSHERFAIPLASTLILPFYLYKKTHKIASATRLLFALLISLASFYIASKIIHSPTALCGTQGTPISIDISKVLALTAKAILNALGVNTGEGYLAGESFSLIRPPYGPLMAGSLVLVLVFQGIHSLFVLSNRTKAPLTAPPSISKTTGIYLILTIIGAATVASITFRQEMRWVYSAHLVIFLLILYLYTRNIVHKSTIITFSIFIILSNAQSLRGAKSIYMISWGAENNSLLQASRTSNLLNGKDIIYCGGAHPDIARQIPKANSIKVVSNWKQVPLETITPNTLLCEYSHNLLRIIEPRQLRLVSIINETGDDLRARQLSLDQIGIKPTNQDSYNLSDPRAQNLWSTGSTLGGPEHIRTASGPITLNPNEFIRTTLAGLPSHRRYMLVVVTSSNAVNNAEAHVAVTYSEDNPDNFFRPFACSNNSPVNIFYFSTPTDTSKGSLILGHHRLEPFQVKSIAIFDLGGV
jgi:hypothetical protein